MNVQVRRRFAGLTIAALVAATLAGPGWAARPDDRAGMLGIGGIGARATEQSTRPDDRGTPRGPGSISILALERPTQAVRPDDLAGARGPGAIGGAPVTTAHDIESGEFPWAQIGMGSVVLAALGLLGAALVLSGRYHRRPA